MSDQKKVANQPVKKSGRVKRSRLGRGLSALVDVPVVAMEIESDNLISNKERSVFGGGLESGVRGVGDVGGDMKGGVERGGAEGGGQVGGKHGGAIEDVDGGVGEVDGVRVESGVARGGAVGVAGGASVTGLETTAIRSSGGGSAAEGGSGFGGGSVGRVTSPDRVEDAVGAAVMDRSTGGGAVEGVIEIEVGLIGVNRDQPRRVFDEGALGALAGSILEHGLMQPVVVRRSFGGDEKYELIAGERRWRASQLAGLETIRAIVRDVDDETSAQLALIENVQREDLNVVELAEGYRVLSDRYSMTQERIAQVVGVSRSSVANTIRLLDLPNEVRDLIVEGKLSSGHGKVLLSLGAHEKQRKFAARCLKEGWNVRQLQGACDDAVDGADDGGVIGQKTAVNTEEDRALSVLRDLEKRVGEELGTRVKIRTDKSRTRGRVVIEFFDLDQFDGLLGRLGVKIEG